ncbi:hypothetical protein SAMN05660461_0343 [Chitinophaga ginsengisegetis]|uniref:Uncharacterized protein n=1 Tax=Chitinophaga ginsengisegetis TaxID=393003 RepID=A0A1T5N5K9_9BACT|nr:hypothetical protein SAMN05660461_0343 [Chitinophaga ginsengisegetis]
MMIKMILQQYMISSYFSCLGFDVSAHENIYYLLLKIVSFRQSVNATG